jgi:hypothetical protein
LLTFLKQENVFYKSRLAEVVNAVNDNETLITSENFNDNFLLQDKMIDFLSGELKEHNGLLEKSLYIDGEPSGEVIRNQKKLRTDIQKAEEIFTRTKKSFSIFIEELL